MTSGVMLVCSMFYTRKEVSERIGWTFQCNGLAVILSGFLQFGLVHTSAERRPSQWQWLAIITAILTFVTALLFLLFFPDNPLNARFFTPEERAAAVHRVRENQNGIETKTWKQYQLAEAMWDPKTWLYFIFMAFGTLTGGVALQYSLLIQSFGFTQLQTTLLSVPLGVTQIVGISSACYAVRRFPVSMIRFLYTREAYRFAEFARLYLAHHLDTACVGLLDANLHPFATPRRPPSRDVRDVWVSISSGPPYYIPDYLHRSGYFASTHYSHVLGSLEYIRPYQGIYI